MAEPSARSAGPAHSGHPVSPPRRSFLARAFAVAIGAIVTIFPFLAGFVAFADPWRRSSGAKKVRIAPLAAVPDDGVPRLFPVIADLVDAWTTIPDSRIGAVYLIREKGSDKIRCLTAECPHAGCMVAYNANRDLFICPCHTSAFDLNGDRRLDVSKVPPRGMDPLECVVKDGEVWVEFQRFYTGHETRKAIS